MGKESKKPNNVVEFVESVLGVELSSTQKKLLLSVYKRYKLGETYYPRRGSAKSTTELIHYLAWVYSKDYETKRY